MRIVGKGLRGWALFVFAGGVVFACSDPRTYRESGGGQGGGAGSPAAGGSGRAAGAGGTAGSSSGRGGTSSGDAGSSTNEAGRAEAGATTGGGTSNGARGGSGGDAGGAGEPMAEAGTGGADAGDPCEANPCKHGTCEAEGTSYSCSCETGYRGDHCELDIDDCKDDPCKNGTCIDGVAAFQCDCGDTGYTGNLCETLIQNCAQTPCLNGGTCTDVGASRTCNCTGTGATGTSCEVDVNECEDDPCDALTSCTNSTGGFSCGNCPSGYTGTGLSGCNDINECSTNNGGCDTLTTCTNTAGSRTCGPCPNGYSGTGATGCTNINDCAGSPCKNGGTCQDGINAFNCACTGSWSGSTCQNATLTINASARGYYADLDWLPPSNGNTLTGWSGQWLYASFFIFPIPSFTGKVSSVTLRLEHENYDSADASEIVTVRDVSTPVATLLSNTMANQTIFQDLSTGTQYGTLNGWSQATVGTIRSFALSGAITPVANARGSSFAIGVSLSPVKVADKAEYVRFSADVEARTHQLEVVVVPP